MDSNERQFLPFQTLEEELMAPLRGVHLTEVEFETAKILLRATTERPVKQGDVIMRLSMDGMFVTARQMRHIIRNLRRMHALPICSRKCSPAGYWWGRTEAELEEFAKVFFAQIEDEAQTVGIMLKKNYPRLAGQMRLELGVNPEENDVSS